MNGDVRRCGIAVSGAAVVALGGATVAASTGDTATPPAGRAGHATPAGSASGSIVNVDFFQTCISCTSAHAGTRRPSGEASAIRVLGHEVAGGASVSDGSQRGALLALPVNPFIRLAIAGWRAGTGADAERSTSFSHSRAALLDLALLGDAPAESLLTVALLESTSDATCTGPVSRGEAVADGAHVSALHGAVVVDLLHSEASSGHPSSSYLLSVNGNRLLASSRAAGTDDGTPTTIPGVLAFTLLQASGDGSPGAG